MGSPGLPWGEGGQKEERRILETEETGRVLITPASGPGITDRPAVSMQSEIKAASNSDFRPETEAAGESSMSGSPTIEIAVCRGCARQS